MLGSLKTIDQLVRSALMFLLRNSSVYELFSSHLQAVIKRGSTGFGFSLDGLSPAYISKVESSKSLHIVIEHTKQSIEGSATVLEKWCR